MDHPVAALEEAREEYRRGDNVAHGLRLVVVEKKPYSAAGSDRDADDPGDETGGAED